MDFPIPRGSTPRNKRLKKLMKQISKSERQTQRFGNYITEIQSVRPRSRSVIVPNDARKRKLAELSDSDDFYEDRLPDNYANLSLRDAYRRNSSRISPSTSPGSPDVSDEVKVSTDLSPHKNNAEYSKPKKLKSAPSRIDEVEDLSSSLKTEVKEKLDISPQWPMVTFADVGGLNNILDRMVEILDLFEDPEKYDAHASMGNNCNFLLEGPSGCGKTLLAHAIAGEFKLPFIKIRASSIISGVSGESEKTLREVFTKADNCAPCIMFIDDIDKIAPRREISDREISKRIVNLLVDCMDELTAKRSRVLIIGATNRPDSLDPELQTEGQFDQVFSIDIPNAKARFEILKVIGKCINFSPEFDMQWLAENTPGYVGRDLVRIVRAAIRESVTKKYVDFVSKQRNEKCIAPSTSESYTLSYKDRLSFRNDSSFKKIFQTPCFLEKQHFKNALRSYIPCIKKEGFPEIPSITWDEVGAVKDVKEQLQEDILWSIKYRRLWENSGGESCSGLLLYGPKGCGKTLIAQAVANECGINFLSVKGPEFLNKYLGESERAVRECFKKARQAAPCVIFFDEIDAICPPRSSSGHSPAANTIVNMMLTEIDGIEKKKQNIFIMATTNRPNDIDSAMLRPGRLEHKLYVGPPNQQDRHDILRVLTKNGTKPKLAANVSLEQLSQDPRCEGFSGADLAGLIRKSFAIAFNECVHRMNAGEEEPVLEIKIEHFEKAFAVIKPSISKRDMQNFEGINSTSQNSCTKNILQQKKVTTLC